MMIFMHSECSSEDVVDKVIKRDVLTSVQYPKSTFNGKTVLISVYEFNRDF